jgi:hypothetical protein
VLRCEPGWKNSAQLKRLYDEIGMPKESRKRRPRRVDHTFAEELRSYAARRSDRQIPWKTGW